MPAPLLERIRAASRELEIALDQAKDPAFDARRLDLLLVQRLQAAVTGVERASAEASAQELVEVRADPSYRAYREQLARLQAVLDAWHGVLSSYRAELEWKSGRVHAALRWAEAYNRTR